MPYKSVKFKPPHLDKEYDLFYYTISLTNDGKPVVNQVPEQPADVHPDWDSVLVIEPSPFAINITWLTGKPAPETDARNKGLIAVMQDLADISGHPEILEMFGIGHLYKGKAEIHENH